MYRKVYWGIYLLLAFSWVAALIGTIAGAFNVVDTWAISAIWMIWALLQCVPWRCRPLLHHEGPAGISNLK